MTGDMGGRWGRGTSCNKRRICALKNNGKALKKVLNHKSWTLIGPVGSLFRNGLKVEYRFRVPTAEGFDNKRNEDNTLASTLMEMLIVLSDFHLL